MAKPPRGNVSVSTPQTVEFAFLQSDLSKVKLLVVGDVMLDRYLFGDVMRISPEAPVPVLKVNEQRDLPGGAANVARNIAEFGCEVGIVAGAGRDEAGATLEQLLSKAGITTRFHHFVDQPTTLKMRGVSQHQQLFRIDYETPLPRRFSDGEWEDFNQALAECDALILSDYGKGYLAEIEQIVTLAKAQGKIILADPKGDHFGKYRGATVITPNKAELRRVIGDWQSEEELVEKAQALREQLSLTALLLTRGEEGMTLFRQEGVYSVTAKALEVFDVSGAGDTVISVLGVALAWGASWEAAIDLANAAAGIVVGKLGSSTVSLEELRRAVLPASVEGGGIVDEERLAFEIELAQAAGKRVVMTNGCFDLLHPGHVSYLEESKALGDYLVVAVNDDASVKRLKGESRPVNPLPVRMRMLAALAAVDWVVPFLEDTPERLICRLKPDVLVKGGDYVAAQVAGADCVIEAGGEVRILDFVEGFSTTGLIEKLQGGNRQ